MLLSVLHRWCVMFVFSFCSTMSHRRSCVGLVSRFHFWAYIFSTMSHRRSCVEGIHVKPFWLVYLVHIWTMSHRRKVFFPPVMRRVKNPGTACPIAKNRTKFARPPVLNCRDNWETLSRLFRVSQFPVLKWGDKIALLIDSLCCHVKQWIIIIFKRLIFYYLLCATAG